MSENNSFEMDNHSKFRNIASPVELLTMTMILAIQDWDTIPNACFPGLWYQRAYLCTPPLSEWHRGIRVTSGYPGDISEGGMHYPNRTINLSQLTVNHCRHGTAWWCLLISRVIALEIDFAQNLSKYLHKQPHRATCMAHIICFTLDMPSAFWLPFWHTMYCI